jgi:hypothetical protein
VAQPVPSWATAGNQTLGTTSASPCFGLNTLAKFNKVTLLHRSDFTADPHERESRAWSKRRGPRPGGAASGLGGASGAGAIFGS